MNRSCRCIDRSKVVLATHCDADGEFCFRSILGMGVTVVKAQVDDASDSDDDAKILLGCAATTDKNAKLCHSLLDRAVAAVIVVALIIPPSNLIDSRGTLVCQHKIPIQSGCFPERLLLRSRST